MDAHAMPTGLVHSEGKWCHPDGTPVGPPPPGHVGGWHPHGKVFIREDWALTNEHVAETRADVAEEVLSKSQLRRRRRKQAQRCDDQPTQSHGWINYDDDSCWQANGWVEYKRGSYDYFSWHVEPRDGVPADAHLPAKVKADTADASLTGAVKADTEGVLESYRIDAGDDVEAEHDYFPDDYGDATFWLIDQMAAEYQSRVVHGAGTMPPFCLADSIGKFAADAVIDMISTGAQAAVESSAPAPAAYSTGKSGAYSKCMPAG